MTAQPQSLSIIETYASSRLMHKDALVATLMRTIAPHDKSGNPMASMEDIVVFLQIAHRFDLDPFAREIYMIVNRGQVKPYISVDGYAKIVNRQADFDGVEFSFEQDADGSFLACTCTMWRKDRSRPTIVTEFMSECYRPDSEAWKRSPARMLRHRAFIQAARLCFGISAALDEDAVMPTVDVTPHYDTAPEPQPAPKAPRTPRKPPSPKQEDAPKQEEQTRQAEEVVNRQTGEVFDPEEFLTDLDTQMATGINNADLNAIWSDYDVDASLTAFPDHLQRARDLKDWHEGRIKRPSNTQRDR
jgi:hypothetical protein